jgi:hypothetical protein
MRFVFVQTVDEMLPVIFNSSPAPAKQKAGKPARRRSRRA